MTVSPQAPRHATATTDPAGDGPTIGALVQEASASISTIIRGEIELAKLELRSSVKNGGLGVGMFAAAGVLLVFSLTFGLLALAEGLITIGLWRWAGYLAVFLLLVVMVALLVFLGFRKVKKVKAPQRTIDTGRDTVAYLTSRPHPAPTTPDASAPVKRT